MNACPALAPVYSGAMGQNGQNGAATGPVTGPCCVLWTPAGLEPPKELIASLERRQLRWTLAQDGYAAMTEVLLRIRAGGAKSAVLVLVQPTQLDLSGLVVDSLGRYAGPVAVWRYDPAAHPVLAAAQRHELATVFVRTESIEPRSSDQPRPAAPQVNDQVDEEEGPSTASLLSDEELSMLLAERPARRM